MDYILRKSLGQHFLRDEHICRKIISAIPVTPGMHLLEVGPGGGALTKYLEALPDVAYKAVEIDPEKVAFLNRAFPSLHGQILEADILKVSCPFDQPFYVVGNFPYNISSQILFRMLEWEPMITGITGMFQKEVARRIASGPGTREYGILSVLMQTFFQVTYLFDVDEHCFIPPPKVKSGVLQCSQTGNPFEIADKKKFFRLVKAAFGQRRKVLRNALKPLFPLGVPEDEPLWARRAEQLSVAEFVYLYRTYL